MVSLLTLLLGGTAFNGRRFGWCRLLALGPDVVQFLRVRCLRSPILLVMPRKYIKTRVVVLDGRTISKMKE